MILLNVIIAYDYDFEYKLLYSMSKLFCVTKL